MAPGVYPIDVTRGDGSEAVRLNAFVMVGYDRMKQGVLDGYRIGPWSERWYALRRRIY